MMNLMMSVIDMLIMILMLMMLMIRWKSNQCFWRLGRCRGKERKCGAAAAKKRDEADVDDVDGGEGVDGGDGVEGLG